jgi:alpha-glucosidase
MTGRAATPVLSLGGKMITIETRDNESRVHLGDLEVLRHSARRPLLEIGRADFHYRSTGGGMHRVERAVEGWLPLPGCETRPDGLRLFAGEAAVELRFEAEADGFSFLVNLPEGFNVARLNLPAERGEAVYGGGVQFGALNLRGRRFPIWTSEMGLGRHPLRPYTWLANWIADAGGEYWNTYFPQPSFLSRRGYGCLIETGGYSLLDFTAADRHRLEFPAQARLRFFAGKELKELIGKLAGRLGIMPAPPAWVFEGGILGIQGGLPYVRETVERVLAAGARLTGIWTQDWAGVRIFWQGKRLYWNWIVNPELYPDLAGEIRRRREQGIRWLAYINPYFNVESEYFRLSRERGYLVRNPDGETHIASIAGFQVGIMDLTNPEAARWFKEEIIQKNMLALGLRGWMADYGEDIPEAVRFHDGRSGADMHNLYPLLWAQLNRQAVEEAGLQDEVLIFHRSGYTGATRFMNMNWGGDQVVYWNRHDGFPAGVTGGLSACMSAVQYYHTDAGGYFSFKWIKRSKEVLFRWCEANALSPLLRTHEGNRPWAGVQPWQDEETLAHFARMTQIRAALAPYLQHVSDEAQRTGLAMMRPLCLDNPGREWRDKQDAYYLGDDLLVFPVLRPGARRMSIAIPEGEWIGLFSGQAVGPGRHVAACPLGEPVAFYRRGSPFTGLFEEMQKLMKA